MEYMPKDKTAVPPPTEYLPQHIGIIMDGNGRWAKARGLAREYGHRRGSEVFMDIARYCKKIWYSLLDGICLFHGKLEATSARSSSHHANAAALPG